MQKKIYYNQTKKQVSLDQINWVSSKENNQFNQPIFDLNDQEWCSISTTSNQQSLKCFVKEKIIGNNSWYYQDYVNLKNVSNELITFDCYRVEKNLSTSKWERPIWSL